MALSTTNLTLHCDASDTDRLWAEDGMTTHPADTDEVHVWDDEGDATASLLFRGAVIPTYVASGINGLGSIVFDGATHPAFFAYDDAITAPLPASDFISVSGFDVWVALRVTADATNVANVFDNSGVWCDLAGYVGLHVKTAAGVTTLHAYLYHGAAKSCPVTIAQNTNYVVRMSFDGTTLSIDVNNGALTNSVATSGNVDLLTASFTVGKSTNSAGFPGLIGDIATYNVPLSGGPVTDAWDYFAKWVGAAPPSSSKPADHGMFRGVNKGLNRGLVKP